MKEIVFEITAGGNRMTDTNEKNRDTTQKKQNTDTMPQEELNAEPRIGEMPRRNHKDSTFCLLFSEPARAIELYNAVTGENLPPDTELTYTTLANALYIDRNNDLGFVIQKRHLVMSECQSTINWNIPMRCLGYVSRSLENLAGKEGLYGSKLVKFPVPEFYLFYVGNETWNTKTLKLSDSFQAPPKENSLELVVKFINLNYNINNEDNEILQRSPSLLGYSKLLYYIKTAAKENGGDLKSAIDTSVKQCMEEGLIEDFLRKHSREVTGMLFNEITVEEFAEIRAREAYEDGEKSGEKIGFVDGEKYGFTKGEQSGFTKGEKSGFTKGEKSGFTKGETAGLAKGAAQEKREIARNLMQLGLDLAQIRQATGLTAEEIEKL